MNHIAEFLVALALTVIVCGFFYSAVYTWNKVSDLFSDVGTLKSHDDYYTVRMENNQRDRNIADLKEQVTNHKDVLVALSDYHELELKHMPVPRSHVFFVKK